MQPFCLLNCSSLPSQGGAAQQGKAISLLLEVTCRVIVLCWQALPLKVCTVMCGDSNKPYAMTLLLAELHISCRATLALPNRVRALLLRLF